LNRLSIYSDVALTDCTLSDTSPNIVNVYVAENSFYGAIGFRVSIGASPGFTGVWLGETSPFQKLGTSPTDLSVVFGSCRTGSFLVLTMSYQLFGTSTCSNLAVAAASGLLAPVCLDCFDEAPCVGNVSLHVNCTGLFDCNPVPVEPSTWGRVKALYRN
jgi:hypothetical protein